MTAVDVAQDHGGGSGEKGLKGRSPGPPGQPGDGVRVDAPAYRLAASLSYVVTTANGNGIVGVKAPRIMVIAFIPMDFIAVA